MEGIGFKQVNYHYPRTERASLKNINLSLKKGRFYVLMGETGAGKSTLLKCINGVIPQLEEGTLTGEVSIEGQSIERVRVQELTQVVGLVMQDAETQILGRTVEEDVAFGPRNYLVPKEEIFQRIADVLRLVRLDGYQKRDSDSLSGGEKQRLVLADILAMHPEYLLLDEPTSELDPLGREEIYQVIKDLRKDEAKTILAVEHSSQDIIEKADEIIVLKEGEILWKGDTKTFFTSEEVLEESGVKPIPVASLGIQLAKAGFIDESEIPVTLEEARQVVGKLLDGVKLQSEQRTPETKEPVIDIENMSFRYKDTWVFEDFHLKIPAGSFTAIIGQNGSGKTTLAKQLNGLLTPQKGSIRIQGRDIVGKKPEALAEQIGYVFQNPDHQIFSASLYDEIAFGLKRLKLPSEEREQRIQEALLFTGLEEFKNHHPFSIGKGERQKLAVASILALRPSILVVDEPTTGQDWHGIKVMMDMMEALHSQGVTIIMITHDMDVVSAYADHVILLGEGKLLAQGSPADVFVQTDLLKSSCVTAPQLVELCMALEQPVLMTEEALFAAIFEAKGGSYVE